ncbi:hypothetical protein ACIQU3_36670 [Streptomyces sp. NPDC101110]|uniref:hypothetical protein n=1 Tax=Streptomyces sp. NPDC101110 TaxID=3366104 RepID=UPI003814CD63
MAERLLGSRAALEDLAAGPGWDLLQTFLPGQQHPGQPEDGWWFFKTSVVMTFRALAATPLAPEWDTSQRRAQVDEWARQGLLRRGLALGCQECSAFEFYPLEEITQHYRCRRCGAGNDLAQARPANLSGPTNSIRRLPNSSTTTPTYLCRPPATCAARPEACAP